MRFHRGSDGWGRDSYAIPQYAVVGSSDTGMYSDSPAPSNQAKAELEAFRVRLRDNHIRSRVAFTRSGNIFMVKRWVVVKGSDYPKAKALADEYLKLVHHETRLIHDAT